MGFAFAPVSASAQTQFEIDQDLRGQIAFLTEQVGLLISEFNQRTNFESTCIDVLLGRNLTVGSSGQDVTNLQSYLQSRGYGVAVTGYYGNSTAQVVERWKATHGIDWLWTAGTVKSPGVTDGITRATLRKMCQ